MIKREKYLEKIRPFYDLDLIKVITGIRRCGKSILLTQIMDEIKEKGINENHIIYINFELQEYDVIKNANSLNKYIKNLILDDDKYYIFFDEIGNVTEWEKVVNSLNVSLNVSMFITGSNSNLLSGELATHIAGRYVAFKLNTFSFKEVCILKNIKTREEQELCFNDYLLWGGFPQRFAFAEEREIVAYLENIYDSIVLKDIITRNKIQNIAMLDTLVQYLVSTPSQIFSGTSLAKYFEKDNRTISLETMYNYFDYITFSYIINKVQRFDVRGKKILSRSDKYYLSDLGLSHIKNLSKKIELYFQVAYILADETVVEREFGAYSNIDDNYPKYVLSMDKFDFSQNGIIHKNIIDWLLDE